MQGVKEPQQSRSQQTFARILNATEQLLESQSWPALKIGDIVRVANCSVGSFYARFDGKEALLHCLSERLADDVATEVGAFAPEGGTAELTGVVVSAVLQRFRQRSGLIRALTLVPRLFPDSELQEDGLANARQFNRLVSLLEKEGVPEQRARMGLFMVVQTAREFVLFPEISKQLVPVSASEFEEHLAEALLAYWAP